MCSLISGLGDPRAAHEASADGTLDASPQQRDAHDRALAAGVAARMPEDLFSASTLGAEAVLSQTCWFFKLLLKGPERRQVRRALQLVRFELRDWRQLMFGSDWFHSNLLEPKELRRYGTQDSARMCTASRDSRFLVMSAPSKPKWRVMYMPAAEETLVTLRARMSHHGMPVHITCITWWHLHHAPLGFDGALDITRKRPS